MRGGGGGGAGRGGRGGEREEGERLGALTLFVDSYFKYLLGRS